MACFFDTALNDNAARQTHKTKGCGSRVACLTLVFKLTESASKGWRSPNGSALIPDVIAGVVFVDGIRPERLAA